MSLCESMSSKLPNECSISSSAATSLARVAATSATATRRAPGTRRRRFSAWRRPISPAPSTPTPNLRIPVFLLRRSKLRLYKKTTVQALLATSRFGQDLVTAAAARNIFPASCPRHERGGPPELIPTQRPQRSARPTTTHSPERNRNSPSPLLRPRCGFLFSIQPQPHLAPRKFAPAMHARPDWPHSPRNRWESPRQIFLDHDIGTWCRILHCRKHGLGPQCWKSRGCRARRC